MNDNQGIDGFDELLDSIQHEMTSRVLENAAELGLKTARLTGLIIKEAKEWGVPKDLAEAMGADFWQLIMVNPDQPTGVAE
ncbi:hypothetical protein [Streptomyces sp. NPDC050485]|uniref:hypothetical protein n=1 Tax=Streptomyces sp. NPDC050485 TaxID=3365617 RepID=UPI0037BA10C5